MGKKKSKSPSSQKNAVRLNVVLFIKTHYRSNSHQGYRSFPSRLTSAPTPTLSFSQVFQRPCPWGQIPRFSRKRPAAARRPPPPCPVPQSRAFCQGCSSARLETRDGGVQGREGMGTEPRWWREADPCHQGPCQGQEVDRPTWPNGVGLPDPEGARHPRFVLDPWSSSAHGRGLWAFNFVAELETLDGL